MTTETTIKPLTRKDFVSSNEPKWCIGCGCYGTLNALTSVLPTLGIPREKFAIISGIGCSSRLPYYASTYGFHTIHGRAPTVAIGLKLTNPELSTWVFTGDGDALSIGGNHFMHLMRRNPDVKLVLLNNEIYGLTKGQTSPTSSLGKQTKSTPFGSVDRPVRPTALAIAMGATFVARVPDTDGELLREVFAAAAGHKGVAFIEILLNCVIFNDGAFSHLTNKETRADTTLVLKSGAPLLFGKERTRGIRMSGVRPEVVALSNGETPDRAGIAVHDPGAEDPTAAFMLSQLVGPEFPVPLGIFRQVTAPLYCDAIEDVSERAPEETYAALFRGGASWTVGEGAGGGPP
jgi:2-oxoglutarate ferredoxin oxidoreductase subunit beta